MSKQTKTIADSVSTLSQVILPGMANYLGTAHGGELIKIMDSAAGVCAVRHARAVCVTAAMDNIIFHESAKVGSLVTCHAQLTYAGRSSMEVTVSLDTENILAGEKLCCLTAYFVFVALDTEHNAVEIPVLEYTSEGERKMAGEAQERMKHRRESPMSCWLPYY